MYGIEHNANDDLSYDGDLPAGQDVWALVSIDHAGQTEGETASWCKYAMVSVDRDGVEFIADLGLSEETAVACLHWNKDSGKVTLVVPGLDGSGSAKVTEVSPGTFEIG